MSLSRRRLLQAAAATWLAGCRGDDHLVDWPHGALALALTEAHVYWTSGVDHTGLLRVGRDGGDPRVIYDGMPWGIDLAPGPEAMFVATSRGVERAPYVGLRGQVVVAEAGGAHRVEVRDGSLFWLQRAAGVLRRADLKGRERSTLARGRPWAHDFTIARGYVHWTAGEPGTLFRVPLGGGTVEPLVDGVVGLGPVVAQGDQLHFGAVGGLYRLGLDGGAVEKVVSGEQTPSALRATSDGLWWSAGERLWRWRASSGHVTEIEAGTVLAMAVEGDTVWWIDGQAKALRRRLLTA